MAEATAVIAILKALVFFVPPVCKFVKRTKPYPTDRQISEDIEVITKELDKMNDAAKQLVLDRLDQIDIWLQLVSKQRDEWKVNYPGFMAKWSKNRRTELKSAKLKSNAMKEMAITASSDARARVSTKLKSRSSSGSDGAPNVPLYPVQDLADIAEYYDADPADVVKLFGALCRECKERGMTAPSSATSRGPQANTQDPSITSPTPSSPEPPSARTDSPSKMTDADDSDQSDSTDNSDCASIAMTISNLQLPFLDFRDEDLAAALHMMTADLSAL